ncbi:MAG: tetratricopeptide repeat protein [Anaerolineales bacterium]|jgi:predicted ATPase/DNA-binding SARP family transcriptional activator
MLRIFLLGHFEVTLDGRPAEIDSRPVQLLLAYLALNAKSPQPRDRLAGILWPDSDESNALANLRHALWRLRQAIGEDNYLDISKTTLQLNPDADWWVDTAQLEAARGPAEEIDQLIQAVDLYQGHLLPGFYEDWVSLERDRLEGLFQRKIQTLVESLTHAGKWDEVVAHSERWIALGSSPEPAYRALMQAHAALGDAAAMANTYQRCREALMNDLGVEPSPETEGLYRQLASGERPTPPAPGAKPTQVQSTQPATNLPASTTPFFGRRTEIKELTALLENDDVRLATITGPGGIGKTRLALEVGAVVLSDFPDGVWFVDLSPIRDPDLVLPTTAAALGIKEQADQTPLETLKQDLSDRRMLLLLDNFEHLIEASPLVSQLLASARYLKVFVTSRERLRIQGEQDYPLSPLPVPESTDLDIENLRQIVAVRLFEDRARASDRAFQISPSNAADMAQICQRLEGLPLAIELAAARVNSFSPKALLQRLETRLGALTGGRRDAPVRQQTLRATIQWSYDLLTPGEQRLFNRLAVFNRGWTLEQAEAVCQPDLRIDLFDGLASLLDKSLIIRDESDEPRYGMLETLREFALEALEASDEADIIGSRHAHAYADLVERGAPELEYAASMSWISLLEFEHDNLRAALRWAVDQDRDLDLALRLVGAITPFWVLRGYLREGYTSACSVLARTGPDCDLTLRTTVTLGAARLAYRQNNLEDAGRLFALGLDLAQELQDPIQTAEALEGMGNVDTEGGDYDSAPERFERAKSLYRQAEHPVGVANADMNLAWAAMRTGDYLTAEQYLLEALDLYEDAGSQPGIGFTLSGLGEVYLRQGKLEPALDRLGRSLEVREGLGDKWGMAATLGSLGWAHLLQNDTEQARQRLKRSLSLRREIGDKGGTAWCLEKLAEVAAGDGDPGQAVRLFGAAHTLRQSIHSVIDPIDQPAYEAGLAELKEQLGEGEFAARWDEGASASRASIIEDVLGTGSDTGWAQILPRPHSRS